MLGEAAGVTYPTIMGALRKVEVPASVEQAAGNPGRAIVGIEVGRVSL